MSVLTLQIMEIQQARENNKPTKWELAGKTIKSCPFCFKSNITLVQDDWMHWASCMDCGTEGPIGNYRIGAIHRWQNRE